MALKNKKAQAAFASAVLLLFAGAIYFIGFAGMVNDYMDEKVSLGALVGVEGFFFANVNFFIGAIWLIAVLLLFTRS